MSDDEILTLIKKIYSKYNSCGGELHIVLDDDNYDTKSIVWCLNNSINKLPNGEEKDTYTLVANELLKRTKGQRKKIIEKFTKEYEY